MAEGLVQIHPRRFATFSVIKSISAFGLTGLGLFGCFQYRTLRSLIIMIEQNVAGPSEDAVAVVVATARFDSLPVLIQ